MSEKLKDKTASTENLIGSCLETLKTKSQGGESVYEYDQDLIDSFIQYSKSIS